jgi:hypothetical protein
MVGSLDIDATLTLRDENPAVLIRRIDVIGDGQTLQSWSGPALRFFNYLMAGGKLLPQDTNGTAVADPDAFRQVWYLPFEAQRTGRPFRTFVDTSRFRSLQLHITWGSTADMFGTGTGDLGNGASMNVQAVELENARSAGPFSDLIVVPLSQSFSIANAEERIKLPRNWLTRGILVRVSDSATGYALSDALVTNAKLVLGGTKVLFDATWQMYQNIMQFQHLAGESFETPGITGSRFEGYIFIDPIKNSLEDLIDPRAFSDYDLILDHTGSVKIDVWHIGFNPRNAAAGQLA